MSEITLDAIDKKILLALQGDLDDSPEPYADLAAQMSITEDEVIQRIQRLISEGVIRRFGAMIRHIEAGIGFNGMVVWTVPEDRREEVGNILASFRQVTHCYERPPFGDKGGTLFTMVHASSESECLNTIKSMSEKAGIFDYEVLFSEQELKKTSMTYFEDNDA